MDNKYEKVLNFTGHHRSVNEIEITIYTPTRQYQVLMAHEVPKTFNCC